MRIDVAMIFLKDASIYFIFSDVVNCNKKNGAIFFSDVAMILSTLDKPSSDAFIYFTFSDAPSRWYKNGVKIHEKTFELI